MNQEQIETMLTACMEVMCGLTDADRKCLGPNAMVVTCKQEADRIIKIEKTMSEHFGPYKPFFKWLWMH